MILRTEIAGDAAPATRKLSVFWSKALRMRSLPLLLVLLATFLVYAATLSYRFVYDDNYQILNNSHVLSWHYLPEYFTRNVWSHVPIDQANLYRPFFLVWLRLNMAVWGEEPWGWHLTTVLMHVLVTGLVYLLALRLLKDRMAALVAAAVFAFHPIHVESVAWISGVPESLAAASFIGAFLCYLKQRTHSAMPSVWLVLSLILFGAAVLSKETAVVLPLIIALYEYTVGRSSQRPRWGVRLVPYFLVLSAYFALRTIGTHGAATRGEASLHDVLLSLPWLIGVYLKVLFWPVRLSEMYDFAYVDHAASVRFFVGLGVIATCLGLVWWARKRHLELGTFLAGWFALTLAPALGAFYLAFKTESYHDRYLYLPSFALAMTVALLFQRLYALDKRSARGIAWGGATLLIGAMAGMTYYQVKYWETDETLFERALKVAPENDRALSGYVAELISRGDLPRALALSEQMTKIHPESAVSFRSAASAAFQLNDFSLAERYYSRAVELDPTVSKLYLYVGVCRMKLGQYEAAVEPLQTAFRLDPDTAMIHYTLGQAYMKLGRWPEARNEFAIELVTNRQNPAAQLALAETEAHLQAKPADVVHSRQVSATN